MGAVSWLDKVIFGSENASVSTKISNGRIIK